MIIRSSRNIKNMKLDQLKWKYLNKSYLAKINQITTKLKKTKMQAASTISADT